VTSFRGGGWLSSDVDVDIIDLSATFDLCF
jgi:hypothetical protein